MSGKALFGGRIVVETGDITRVKADGIVNAANSSLMGGGGVDGAIHRAGGPAILQDCMRVRRDLFPNGLPAGEAVETVAGKLPARCVIHTVGPVWNGGSSGEPEKLGSCYTRSLEVAARLGLSTVAFPAISTGVYGYPRELAARVAWEAVTGFLSRHPAPATVMLVFYSASDAQAFLSASGADA
jgi:O-acetyl-ADP-ribose deacetylase (regulator of RNase III)